MKQPHRINHRGKSYQVTGRIRLAAKTFLVLDKNLSARRSRYCVFDAQAGPRGELRAIHVLPRSGRCRQYVEVVRRASEGNVNLPKLIEYHETGRYIYLVLSWIYGRVLCEYLDACREDARSRPSAIESFKLFRGLAHGLRHMHHKRNFVHGDIRPENLILCREPNRLVLIDFGNSWPVERTLRRSAGDGTSEFYHAPEQLRNEPFLDFRSDQFAATVTFYEMLTLDLPYAGLGGKAGIDGYHTKSLEGALVPPSQKSSDRLRLPRHMWRKIDRVVAQGLALSPEKRYPNARDWLRDIDAIQADWLRESTLPAAGERCLTVVKWLERKWSS